jgi:hypothetical protein
MAFININAKPSISSACDLFSLPSINQSATEGYFVEYRPSATIDTNSEAPIEFVIPGTDKAYIDLSHTRLRVKAKIVNEDGTALASTAAVAPVNNFLHSLFSQLSVELNQKVVSSQAGLYNYRALLENLLNYGRESKETHLQSSLFYKDTAYNMDPSENNAGYKLRKQYVLNGEIEMESPIHADIFNQNKYLLNGVQLLLKLYRAKNEFALMTPKTDKSKYKIQITEAVLVVRKIKIAPAIMAAHALTLNKFTAKYPITRCDMRHISIPKGLQNTVIDSFSFGQLPQRVIVALVDSSAFNGNLNLNPYNFEHFNCTYMNLVSDGYSHQLPVKTNFDRKQYVSAYNSLFYGTGSNFQDNGCNISYSDFAGGYMINVFDLTADLTASESHWNQPQTGTLRLELQFAKTLENPIVALIFSEFNNLIEIDQHRQVYTDFAT